MISEEEAPDNTAGMNDISVGSSHISHMSLSEISSPKSGISIKLTKLRNKAHKT